MSRIKERNSKGMVKNSEIIEDLEEACLSEGFHVARGMLDDPGLKDALRGLSHSLGRNSSKNSRRAFLYHSPPSSC